MTGTTETTKREYKLAAEPFITPVSGQVRREILELADGHRSVILVVSNDDAVDVLEALWRAYQAGREDQAADLTIARNDVIRIVPESGPEQTMLVSHVEHHIITLADLDGDEPLEPLMTTHQGRPVDAP